MRIIKNGKVYDLGYSKYETVAKLPCRWEHNSVGNICEVTRELRKDLASGEFYTILFNGGYGRENVALFPTSKDAAMKFAEDRLDYDDYVKFFGDPEGETVGLNRKLDAVLKEKKTIEDVKEYWYDEYRKANQKVSELEKRIAELEAK